MKRRNRVKDAALASGILLAGSMLSACGAYGPPPERTQTTPTPEAQVTEALPAPVYGPPLFCSENRKILLDFL